MTLTLLDGTPYVYCGPSDNIALDQPRVAIEFFEDAAGERSVGPAFFNTVLLDTGANSVLAFGQAMADMLEEPYPLVLEGTFEEEGVSGTEQFDLSAAYRFDFAGTSGERNTILDARFLASEHDISMFGPWGIVGMPAMAGRVTTLDMTVWTGDEFAYMEVDFSDTLPPPPPDPNDRFSVVVDNRLTWDPEPNVRPLGAPPPVWSDIPFLTGTVVQDGRAREGAFLLDTGAQLSVLPVDIAMGVGLDANGDGNLDELDDNFARYETVGGVGGTTTAPVFLFDEFHVPTVEGPDLVWTDLQCLVLDIAGGEFGVFGCEALTSGWIEPYFGLSDEPGYFEQVHFDFRNFALHPGDGRPGTQSGLIYFDLNPNVSQVTDPTEPGAMIVETDDYTMATESGMNDVYQIVLTQQPTHNVRIDLYNLVDPLVVPPNPAITDELIAVEQVSGNPFLVFTPRNWNVPQTVVVSAVDDGVVEGFHRSSVYHRATSFDPLYEGADIRRVLTNIVDMNTAGVMLLPNDDTTDVTEGGNTDSYQVVLTGQPDGEVTVELLNGYDQVTAVDALNPGNDFLTFTPANYETPQTVLVTAVDDDLDEGPHHTRIMHRLDTADADYQMTYVFPKPVNITDNEGGAVAGVQILETGGDTQLVEGGATDAYHVVLSSQPTHNVHVTLDPDTQMGVAPAGPLVFTPANWDSAQTVTVSAVDDDVVEGVHTGTIGHAASSADPIYNGIVVDSVTADIGDNDTAGVQIFETGGDTEVVEGGATDTYHIVLTSQPTHNVHVLLDPDTQVGVAPAGPLVFTPANWGSAQTVTVSAVDDDVAEDAHTGTVVHTASSADRVYDGIAVDGVTARVGDNDIAPLGPVDYLDVEDLDPSAGDLWYSTQTTRGGFLTFEALFDPAGGDVQLALYDEGLAEPPLATSTLVDGRQRLDWLSNDGGEQYYVRLSGANADVELCGVNLVECDDASGTVLVTGTDGADRFEYAPTGSHAVTINGVSYHFTDAEASLISFDGGADDDTVVLNGGNQNETAELWPGYGTFTGADYGVTIQSAETVTVHGGGGFNEARLHDRADARDRFIGKSTYGEMWDGATYHNYAGGFQKLTGMATLAPGVRDLAQLFDGGGNDVFNGMPNEGMMKYDGDDDHFVAAEGFLMLVGYAGDGLNVANLQDSPTSRDFFIGKPTYSQFYNGTPSDPLGGSFYQSVLGFQQTNATATPGVGHGDQARFHDDVGDDVFDAGPDGGTLRYDGDPTTFLHATGFRSMIGYATANGIDQANLRDSPDSLEMFLANATWAKLYNSTNLYQCAVGFEQVTATASAVTMTPAGDATSAAAGFPDKAKLFDGAGDDVFDTAPNEGTLKFDGSPNDFIRAVGFRSVIGYGRNGGANTANLQDSPTVKDTFTAYSSFGSRRETYVKIEDGATHHEAAIGFTSLTATASAGAGIADKAKLYDGRGPDVFDAAPNDGTLKINGDPSNFLRAVGFYSVVGFAENGGIDTSHFQDLAGVRDTFNGTPTYSNLSDGATYYGVAIGFEENSATATPGDGDVANLVGAADGVDTFEAGPADPTYQSYARLYGPGYSNLTQHFDRVYADAGSGDDDQAYFRDSQFDDVLEVGGESAKLYRNATPYFFEVVGFDDVTAESTTQDDDDTVIDTGYLFDLVLLGWWEST